MATVTVVKVTVLVVVTVFGVLVLDSYRSKSIGERDNIDNFCKSIKGTKTRQGRYR